MCQKCMSYLNLIENGALNLFEEGAFCPGGKWDIGESKECPTSSGVPGVAYGCIYMTARKSNNCINDSNFIFQLKHH